MECSAAQGQEIQTTHREAEKVLLVGGDRGRDRAETEGQKD